MPKIIALAGKGGTGKTTISALLLKYLCQKKLTPILAVDADPNANLNELLNMKVGQTIGQIRRELKGDIPINMSRDQYMEMKIQQALLEESGFDLMIMGQPDGPGCYCAANQYLAMTMDHLASNYRYILVDNEAGMEHLSRMNLTKIDHLLVISDPSARGIMTAGRISEITLPLGLDIRDKWLIVNRAPQPAPAALLEKIDETVSNANLPLAGIFSASQELIDYELSGASYLNLDDNTTIIQEAFATFDKVFRE